MLYTFYCQTVLHDPTRWQMHLLKEAYNASSIVEGVDGENIGRSVQQKLTEVRYLRSGLK